MGTLGTGLVLIAALAGILAQLWVLVAAFKKSIVWGLLVFFIPFVSLLFIILNFSEMKYPVLLYLVAILLGAFGGVMADRAAKRKFLEQELRDLTTST